MTQNNWMSLLGLANRARKVVSGEESVIQEVRRGKAKLVLLAKDASDNTMKKVLDKCKYYQVPVCIVESREQLGHSIGKPARVIVCVTDGGFANSVRGLLEEI
ncbi:MAG TPA: YlxQ family RNA-binding protein [Bacillus sp. (in: firmicutes)]|uniref:YlxQ family RNA-binding protein n=1 Tax=Bacillus litorisediminis TaxID=2922713 RepID=UPI001FAE0AFA|nr:YlxQ family RNA-binding protein [Bacillus litorisediminis]HWO77997.1 YlxQ family RNA-binding protein [Bacillus sp. (in: firmicutes)]